jgi:hypothetical protein
MAAENEAWGEWQRLIWSRRFCRRKLAGRDGDVDAEIAVVREELESILRISFGRNLRIKNLPPSTLAGFDLTTHSSNLFGDRRRPFTTDLPFGRN